MQSSLNDLLKLFVDNEFDFVIVGGFAGAIHGSSLVTKDLDLCFILSPENIDKLRVMLKDLHPKLRISPKKLSFLEYPKGNLGFKNLYLATDWGIVDLISEVSGVGDFERVFEKAITVDLFGKDCKVIAIEDLIESKRKMGRPKDLMMIAELEEILKLSLEGN